MAEPDPLESLLRQLLPTPVVPLPPPKPVPSNLEQLLQRLWGGGGTVVCFSCGKPGHGVTRCPALHGVFPFMLPGWKAEKVGRGYAMISPRVAVERRRAENGN